MELDIAMVPFEEDEILSAKVITGELSRKEVRVVMTELIERIRKGHRIVRVYFYENGTQKEHGNNYVTGQWSHHSVKDIPNIHEDELISQGILVRWNESHEETKRILEW